MHARAGEWPLAGRELELTLLLERLHAAGQGEGGVALVGGEPGIGKTRLLDALAGRAQDEGWLVLRGRAYELEGVPPYVLFVEALRGYVRACPPEELAAQLGDTAAVVARVLPEVADRLGTLTPEASLLPGDDRYRMFAAVADFLLTIARSAEAGGLLVVLDDLHWADQLSLLVLRYLTSRLRDGRVLLAGAFRVIGLGGEHPLHDLLAELEREGQSVRLTLGPLTPEATAALVAHLGGAVAAPVTERIHRIADGNPFFVTQLVRHLIGTGRDLSDERLAGAAWETPEGIRDVIARRLARLRPETRATLEMMAVVGERLGYDVLAAASDLKSADLAIAIHEAVVSGLIREVGDGHQFVHALIRQTLYEGIGLPRRRQLHLAAAAAIERIEAADRIGHAATLAAHYRLAGTAATRKKRWHWYRRAADEAARAFAWEESIAHLEAALNVVGDADHGSRCAILLELGELRVRLGTFREALDWFEKAAERARTLKSPELLARAAIGVPIILGMDRDLATGIRALLEEALAALDGAETGLRAQVLAALGAALCQPYYSEFERGNLMLDQAVELARRVGTQAELAATLRYRMAGWQRGRARERYVSASEMLTVARSVGDTELMLQAHRSRLTALVELGDLAAADEEDAAYAQIAERLHQPLYGWLRLIRLGMRALLAGDFGRAEALIAETRTLGQRLGARDYWTPWQEVTLLRELGRLEDVEGVARRMLVEDDRPLNWRCILAWVLSECGQTAAAHDEFERLIDTELQRLPANSAWYLSVAALSEMCASLHDPVRAATLYELLSPYAHVNVSMNGQVTCFGSAERLLGLLAATMGRWVDAARHFEAALVFNSRMNARPWVAHTLHDHAAMLIARGGRHTVGDVRGKLEHAISLYGELGMHYWEERAKSLLTGPSVSAARAPDGLTAREVEVLQMIAAGRSNREIAQELVLSVRTVEKHIETIYSKIGARRRADAAAYAVRRGLVPVEALAT
jgi:DNA-binding NarL/FixJ family response regulator